MNDSQNANDLSISKATKAAEPKVVLKYLVQHYGMDNCHQTIEVIRTAWTKREPSLEVQDLEYGQSESGLDENRHLKAEAVALSGRATRDHS